MAQLRLGATTVALMTKVWPLLNPDDLDGTFDRWLAAVIPIVQTQRRVSAATAANYLTTFRTLVLGADEGFVPTLADRANRKALATSMLVTGPLAVRSALGRGVPIARAVDVAKARSAGAAMRHALDGGRDTIMGAVRADSRAVGWARIASGKACEFCSLLADRGAVYGEDSADFPSHDHCSCSAEPVYR